MKEIRVTGEYFGHLHFANDVYMITAHDSNELQTLKRFVTKQNIHSYSFTFEKVCHYLPNWSY